MSLNYPVTLESLARRIAQLERELASLRGAQAGNLSISANQQGPLPGWLVGGQFGPGVMAKSALHIKNDAGAQAGKSPRMSITDPAGVVRAEAGFLAASGNSPQQWGFRASDASGNPIFDSLGLINVVSSLGITDVGSQNFTSTAFAQVTGSPISFTLARQVNLLAFFLCSGFVSATGGNNIGLIHCNLSNPGPSGALSGNLQFGNGAIQTLMGWRFYNAVPSGAHSIECDAAVAQTPLTFSTTETALQIFLWGA